MTNIYLTNCTDFRLNHTKAQTAAATPTRTPDSLNEAELHTLASRTRAAEMSILLRKVAEKLGLAKAEIDTSASVESDKNLTAISMDEYLQRAA